jgi:hypothetical protein
MKGVDTDANDAGQKITFVRIVLNLPRKKKKRMTVTNC